MEHGSIGVEQVVKGSQCQLHHQTLLGWLVDDAEGSHHEGMADPLHDLSLPQELLLHPTAARGNRSKDLDGNRSRRVPATDYLSVGPFPDDIIVVELRRGGDLHPFRAAVAILVDGFILASLLVTRTFHEFPKVSPDVQEMVLVQEVELNLQLLNPPVKSYVKAEKGLLI